MEGSSCSEGLGTLDREGLLGCCGEMAVVRATTARAQQCTTKVLKRA